MIIVLVREPPEEKCTGIVATCSCAVSTFKSGWNQDSFKSQLALKRSLKYQRSGLKLRPQSCRTATAQTGRPIIPECGYVTQWDIKLPSAQILFEAVDKRIFWMTWSWNRSVHNCQHPQCYWWALRKCGSVNYPTVEGSTLNLQLAELVNKPTGRLALIQEMCVRTDDRTFG